MAFICHLFWLPPHALKVYIAEARISRLGSGSAQHACKVKYRCLKKGKRHLENMTALGERVLAVSPDLAAGAALAGPARRRSWTAWLRSSIVVFLSLRYRVFQMAGSDPVLEEGVSALAVRVRRGGRSGGHKNWRHYLFSQCR